jgi:hypothetical protein
MLAASTMSRECVRTSIAVSLLVGYGLIAGGRLAHGQTNVERRFVGTTKCAACHFNQYKTWKSSAHGRGFDILPQKYQRDPSCLKCHTTGFGQPTTLDDPSAVYVTGVNCEACHGPGSEHVQFALRLVEQDLTEAGLNQLRAAIQRASLERCIACHQSVAHGTHPPFQRESASPARQSQHGKTRAESLFSFQAHPSDE